MAGRASGRVLAAGGVVLLMEGGGDLDLIGVLFALAAGTCWGLYILVGAALGRHTTEGNGLALGMAVAALVAVPFGVADSGTALIQPWVLVAGLGVALLSSVIPYSLDLEALRRIPPRVFGILMSLEPAMAALIGLIVLGESLHWSQWIAVLCVVAASAGATRGARSQTSDRRYTPDLFTGLPLGPKATVKIPIGCFALNGLDLTNVNTPFLIYTEGPFQASFTNIRWVPGAANDPDAKACANLH